METTQILLWTVSSGALVFAAIALGAIALRAWLGKRQASQPSAAASQPPVPGTNLQRMLQAQQGQQDAQAPLPPVNARALAFAVEIDDDERAEADLAIASQQERASEARDRAADSRLQVRVNQVVAEHKKRAAARFVPVVARLKIQTALETERRLADLDRELQEYDQQQQAGATTNGAAAAGAAATGAAAGPVAEEGVPPPHAAANLR